MAQLFANNVSTKLDTSIQSTATSMTVLDASAMPTPTGGDYFLLTLVGLVDGKETSWEIVKVTARSGNTLTIVRAQEGTTAVFWAGGTKVELRMTAAVLNGFQSQIDGKQATITGAATTIAASNLTASMAMVTDASGKVAAHGTVSAVELGYLDGVTSAIQTQLNGKAASSHNHDASNITSGTLPVVRGGTGATTLTGLVKGNGTGAMTAAVAGTDYVTPSGSITGNAATATTLQTARTINGVSFDGSANITIADSTKIPTTEKGAANGVATLDANGKVSITQIPDSVLGQLEYMGVHNFTTMPTATQKGQYWIASVAGNGYEVGDWAVYNGTNFDKVDNTDAATSTTDAQVFTTSGTWTKPAGAKYIKVMCIAGGGGGGGGSTMEASAGSGITGGKGGGAGGASMRTLHADSISTLTVIVGAGGNGGGAGSGSTYGSAGQNGGASFVYHGNSLTSYNEVLVSASSGMGGQSGTTFTGGAGTGGNGVFEFAFTHASVNGAGGVITDTGTDGVSSRAFGGGGAGCGVTNTANQDGTGGRGGGITGTISTGSGASNILTGAGGGTPSSIHGGQGISQFGQGYFAGGGGGGGGRSAATPIGGNGGNGGFPAGGGGGGASTIEGGTPGSGGAGGNGIVVIWSW